MDKKTKNNIKKYISYIVRYICIPVLLEIIIESLNRKSLFEGVRYLFDFPALFVFNTLIIMLTMSIALFFKREFFVYCVVVIIWLVVGVVNFVVLQFRVTPFSAVDITLLESAISISGHYLTPLNVLMIFVGLCVVLAGLVCMFRMAPKHSHRTQKKLIVASLCVSILILAIVFLKTKSNSVQALKENYTNIAEAYENYGFVYCFTNSIIDTGISEPEDYSEERIKSITEKFAGVKTTATEKPNIIFIQLESFFDVDTLNGLELSKDPIPTFHALQKKFSSGYLTVPTVGAGTVNTEFEVLTGMSQKDFGTSEYPYKTILRDTAAESVCYDLKNIGYSTHCVHNNEGTFYGRNKVFANLGFDTFTSMEYMNGLEDNPNGWKKDRVLTGEILSTLDSTTGPDLTLGITVQSHGKYAGFEVEHEQIKVNKAPEGMEESYSYYVNQIHEVDQMINDLIKVLEQRQEKSVVVLYGDHLPSLDISKKDLKETNLYQTEYVVWDNFDLEKIDENLTSYQLYPEVLKRLGIHEGNITKFHQNSEWKTKSYHEELLQLEYDMLYGERYAYTGTYPYLPTNLQMGTEPLKITDISTNEKGYLVSGSGFTPYTHVLFSGEEVSMEWIDDSHIQILEELSYDSEAAAETPSPQPDQKIEPENIPNAFVVQVQTEGGTVLGESGAYRWENSSLAK